MTRIEKVGVSMTGLPPAWISRTVSGQAALGNYDRIRKMLGEPLPTLVDPNKLPPNIKEFFAPRGLLKRLAKKLKNITKKNIKNILPAKNTIASIDEDDNLYVGVDFLEIHGENEALIAGIVAHEWGHLISTLPKNLDLDHLTYDDIFAIRREEEAYADGFAGRALYLLGYRPEDMAKFLEDNAKKRKLPTHKYHNTATRTEIIRQSYKAMEQAMDSAMKLFYGKDMKFGRVLGNG